MHSCLYNKRKKSEQGENERAQREDEKKKIERWNLRKKNRQDIEANIQSYFKSAFFLHAIMDILLIIIIKYPPHKNKNSVHNHKNIFE